MRDRRPNAPEWVEWGDEPVRGYPQRLVPRDEYAAKALKKRTLKNLYNGRPQWLVDARDALASADGSNPAISGHRETGHFWRPETGVEFYLIGSCVRKVVWTLVRQLRGPHLSTCA